LGSVALWRGRIDGIRCTAVRLRLAVRLVSNLGRVGLYLGVLIGRSCVWKAIRRRCQIGLSVHSADICRIGIGWAGIGAGAVTRGQGIAASRVLAARHDQERRNPAQKPSAQ
jgi:hypothetical protein